MANKVNKEKANKLRLQLLYRRLNITRQDSLMNLAIAK